MGNTVYKPCVPIGDHEFTKDSYTIMRTSGEMEKDWVMGRGCGSPEWITQHAMKKEGDWSIYMHNGKDDINTVVQGWRRLPTIYPTRLEGNAEAIEEWRSMVRGVLDKLGDADPQETADETKNE